VVGIGNSDRRSQGGAKNLCRGFLGNGYRWEALYQVRRNCRGKGSDFDGRILSPHLDEVKVRFFGDNLAVLYGRESSIRKSKEGKEYTRRVIWTDTWLKPDGRWQIIAVQTWWLNRA
jgi:hypothetical protein